MYRITTLMVVQNVSALEKPNYVLLILLLNKHRYIRVCPLSACQGCIQVYSCVSPVSLSGAYTGGGAQPFWTSQKGGALLPIEIGNLNIYFFTNLLSPISLQHDC